MLYVKYDPATEYPRDFFEKQPLLNELFSDAPDAIFILNSHDYSIIDCNHKALEFFETENKSSLINLSSFRLYESEPIEFSRNLLEANIKNGGEHTQELAFRTLKQNVFWGKLSKRSVKTEDFEFIILRISKAFDYLNSEKALSEILRGTAKVTGVKYFKELTKLLCRTFNVKYSFIGKFVESGKYYNIVDSYGPFTGLSSGKNPVKRCLVENVLKGYTTYYPAGSKDLFPGDKLAARNNIEGFMGTPVFGSTGEVVGIIAFMNDFSIQEIPNSRYILSIFASRTAAEFQRIRSKEILKEQSRDLADANVTKDKLLSVLSHDLLNPLHSIMGFSELLQIKGETYEKKKILSQVAIIDNSIKNIYCKLENISDWSVVYSEKLHVNPENIFLENIVQENLSLFEFLIKNKELNISVSLADCPPVNTDKHMLNSIVRNLLSNAVKNTPKGGNISFSFYEKSNNITFVVQDNGVGMLQENLDKITGIRTRESETIFHKDQSSGIGYIIINKFMECLKGSYTVKSGPETGTKVAVTLPKSI